MKRSSKRRSSRKSKRLLPERGEAAAPDAGFEEGQKKEQEGEVRSRQEQGAGALEVDQQEAVPLQEAASSGGICGGEAAEGSHTGGFAPATTKGWRPLPDEACPSDLPAAPYMTLQLVVQAEKAKAQPARW